MKKYKVKVTLKDGSVKNVIYIKSDQKVQDVIFETIPKDTIKTIEAECTNASGGKYWILTYDSQLEYWKSADRNIRIEITWKPGFEDYSNYGSRTEGKKQRCYIGKSTGWIPCYLTIFRSNSKGGGALSMSMVKSIKAV